MVEATKKKVKQDISYLETVPVSLFDKPKLKSTILRTKAQKVKENHLLPQDELFSSATFTRLFTKPKGVLRFKKTHVRLMEADEAEEEEQNDGAFWAQNQLDIPAESDLGTTSNLFL